ncbi:transporter, Ni2+-Co2+ transporter (NiCoT) family protein [Micrococcus luteus SK58]|nr:transporter, Ni2+-Co2+ transporter (NiCoT) family protein [Micrococcus luteus SK58]
MGLAFSLGHSLVVTLAAVLAVAGAGLMQGAFADGSPANRVLGLIGTGVSGGYLLLLGVYNGVSALRLRRASAVRRPGPAEEPTGLVTRLLRAPLRRVRSPRDIFVIGFLFGLGFDTATTIGLLLLAVSVSAAGIPLVTLLALPVAFTAAMTLCDTTNGLGMMRLYSSALQQSERRRRFNLVVTSVSAVSALFIAVLTLGAFVHELLGLTDPVTTWLAEVDLGHAGLALVGVFALIWLCAALLEHRRGRVRPVGDGA